MDVEDYDYEEQKEEIDRARGLVEELDVGGSTGPLPIMEHRATIIETLRKDDIDVMLIEGDTGCGKSTKVTGCEEMPI